MLGKLSYIQKHMNIQKLKLLLATACLAPLPLTAQITERERPAEWKHLITGGRYMDRFEAMPDGTLSGETWGADSVQIGRASCRERV